MQYWVYGNPAKSVKSLNANQQILHHPFSGILNLVALLLVYLGEDLVIIVVHTNSSPRFTWQFFSGYKLGKKVKRPLPAAVFYVANPKNGSLRYHDQ